MKNLYLPSLLFLGLFFCLSSCRQEDLDPVLTIEGGEVTGVETPTKGITVYKGIPFAAPPVGKYLLDL